ncbi:MAG: twin-arginine translocation pathway signal protein, partial [Gemmatimonadales bacterium]|nr:twin-arginine translocation pathway signal protein [Gemmatimonadales bacterium]NIN12945.1 twin-arginine translocation pathway signal protein [Gemmatimonadales bacterium]NIR02620.1 twin-arginine translocation pathway signal protein [Gemmatimonadales bacterium]NIS67196.1 twin-arginine translocation pathway signal protein [Gemmatimonadales bacterium]
MRASQPVSAVAVLLACSLANCGPGRAQAFRSEWHRSRDHGWAGPAFWTNRLQDWRVQGGRLEAIAPLPLRTAHLLTRRLEDGAGDLELTATVGPLGVSPADTGRSSAGFLVGAGRGLDYRAAALIHHARGPSAGLYAGLDTDGRAFLRDLEQRDLVIVQTAAGRGPLDSATLRLTARARGATYEITLEAALWNASRDTIRVTTGGIPGERLVGGVALVSDSPEPDGTTFWFSHFTATGSKLARYDDRTVGPVIGTQHTLSRGRLKLTAQFMPLGPDDSRTARLQIADGRGWVEVATAEVVIPGYTATFGVADWDATRDAPFRVAYDLARTDGTVQRHYMHGTVRRDPIDQDSIVVAAFTGNHNVQSGVDRRWFPWGAGVWFPHADLVERVLAHDPDFLFFSGDQVYEGASPTRADLEHPFEDYLYKWYLWYWAFGRLTAEIPAVTIPDDHDVYHGNLWGAGGRATPPGLGGAAAQDAGGYKRSAEFVNMVQRTHASHLPDPHDPTPVEQGIGVYYTDVRYGGVSFAVLEDRKFKSAPAALLPAADIWNGWPRNREFDAKTQADVPGATLLGERQLAFLDAWAADWSGGVWMKVALSQTLFANVATLPDSATTGSVIPSLPVPEPG